jgi:hypothetical protein
MSSYERIVSVVDDDIGTATFFHEALRQNIDGISVFSFMSQSRHLKILQRTKTTMH